MQEAAAVQKQVRREMTQDGCGMSSSATDISNDRQRNSLNISNLTEEIQRKIDERNKVPLDADQVGGSGAGGSRKPSSSRDKSKSLLSQRSLDHAARSRTRSESLAQEMVFN